NPYDTALMTNCWLSWKASDYADSKHSPSPSSLLSPVSSRHNRGVGMLAHVVQTRTTTVGCAPQTDLPRQRIERSMNVSAIQPIAPAGDKQIGGHCPSRPMALASGNVVRKHHAGRSMQRHQASFAELGAADRQHRRLQIDILQLEVLGFA